MNDDRWLTPDELRAWRSFVAVVEILSRTLDSELQREAQLSHFDYYVLAMLSEAPDRTLRMTTLARETNATLPRLSHVVARLEHRGYVVRTPCAADRRATNATLTDDGWSKVVATAPGHVRSVLAKVIDPLTGRDIADLERIMGRILAQVSDQ
jgi:DNA-binding MarR family transcriptional regulator